MNKRTEAANNATSSASLLHGRVVCHWKTRRTETIIIALREREKKERKESAHHVTVRGGVGRKVGGGEVPELVNFRF